MSIKHLLIIAAMCMAIPRAAFARGSESGISIESLCDIDINVDEAANKVNLTIDLDLSCLSISKERQLILTPMFVADNHTDSLMLDPIIVAGKNRWYQYLRSGILDDGKEPIFRAGKKMSATYARNLELLPWMEQSSFELKAETSNCCDAPVPLPGIGSLMMAQINTAKPTLNADYVFAPPVDTGPLEKSISGRAFVTFVVNKTDMDPKYMDNRKELDKIFNSIEYVRDNPDATITHIHIKGYASPEGSYDNNTRLAQGRTETLRRHVRDLYHFPDSTVTSSYEPEDWAGLRGYMTDSLRFNITHRGEIIDIIDGPLGFDNKNLAIQTRFPEDYKVILNEIYPWLRHSDYAVNYVIKIYTTLDDIKRVYAEDPSNLRPVDFYTLAGSYPKGSPEYCDVFDTAIKVHPDDPMLNLNAVNIALMRDEYDQAQSHLLKAGHSPSADYARGILAAKCGDYDGAKQWFSKAKEAGLSESEKALSKTEDIIHHNPVTYTSKEK